MNDSVILIAGRFQPTIEEINFISGERSIMTHYWLDVNHLVAVKVDPIDRNDEDIYKWKIWIPCGFTGHTVNGERSKETILIIQKHRETGEISVKKGPPMPQPRGACNARLLHLKGKGHPGYVCVFAGSDGSHKRGRYSANIDCYDRVQKVWIGLTPTPKKLDHHSMADIPRVKCPDGSTIGPSLFIFNGRTKSYGNVIPEVYSLDLPNEDDSITADELLRLHQQANWGLFTLDPVPRDAAASVVSHDGRYIILLGGIHHHTKDGYEQNFMRAIRVLDLCQKKWYTSRRRLYIPRFAVQACIHPRFPLICGGTYLPNRHAANESEPEEKINAKENLASCELLETERILEELIEM